MKRTTLLASLSLLFSSVSPLFAQQLFVPLGGPPGVAWSGGLTNNGYYVVYGNNDIYRMPIGDSVWQKVTGWPEGDAWNSVSVGFIGRDGNLYQKTENFPTNDVLWKSDNAGGSWVAVNSNIDSLPPYLITSTGRFVIISDGFEVSISDDYGLTQTKVRDSNASYIVQEKSFQSNGDILVGIKTANGSSLWRGTNNGLEWEKLFDYSNTPEQSVDWFAESPDGKILIRSSDNYYISSDNGTTWSFVNIPFGNGLGFIFFSPTSRLFVHEWWEDWKYSDDFGQTWSKCQTSNFNTMLYIAPLSNGELLGFSFYINGTLDDPTGIYRSTDNGASWSIWPNGLDNSSPYQILFDSENRVVATTTSGLWRKSENPLNWVNLLDNSINISGLHTYPEQLATYITNQGDIYQGIYGELFVSTDEGGHFTSVELPDPFGSIIKDNFGVNPYSNTFLINTGWATLRSTDKGHLWISIPQNLEEHFKNMIYLSSSTVLTIKDDELGDVWRSDDDGQTWYIDNNFPQLRQLKVGRDGKLYGIGQNSIFISADNGATWEQHTIPTTINYSQNPIAITNSGHVYLAVRNNSSNARLWRSLDGGASWAMLPKSQIGLPDKDITALELGPDNTLYIGIKDNGIYKSAYPLGASGIISGRITRDTNANCLPDGTDPGLANLIVEADGVFDFYTKTDSAGRYEIVADTGTYILRPRLWNSLYENCQLPQNVFLSDSAQVVDSVDFAVSTLLECPYFEVSVSTPMLRRCFENDYYLSYCNYGTAAMPDAEAQVVLDPRLDFVSASQAVTVSGDTLRFALGPVEVGDCGGLSFRVVVNCDSTEIGQTLCVEALIFPDSGCIQPDPAWSGAHVAVSARCEGDTSVQFTIRNTGTAPTSSGLEYIIIEDQIVLREGDISLPPGDSMTLAEMALGSTWRIEAEQEPFHPGFSAPTAVLEGCGGLLSTGFFNQLPLDDADPFVDVDCRQVIGSWDPNDKQGFPTGFDNQHFIRPGTELEYFIRFQNTGTNTTFRVVVVDTLSALLDPGTLRMGASSHPYTWEISGSGTLKITFSNIHLPDSNINEAASHGFVRFRIAQKPGLPNGTVIRNEAGIFFDFNPAVLTNQTWHTVRDNFLIVKVLEPQKSLVRVEVSPNPFAEQAVFSLKNPPAGEQVLRLLRPDGRLVRTIQFSGEKAVLHRDGLAEGLYLFEVLSAGKVLAAGKVAAF